MGRRGANQLAVSIAALGTLFCGLSMNMEMLIAARFVRYSIGSILLLLDRFLQLSGMGGGGIVTTST
jgi:MFS family permease